jgi:hypothetical protein
LIANEKVKAPPLYMPLIKEISLTNNIAGRKGKVPSSGVIVSVKLSRSAGSAKWVFIVDGKSSSVKSMEGSKLFSSHFE